MEDVITEHQDSEYSYYSLFQNESDLVYTTSLLYPSVTASMNMNYHSPQGIVILCHPLFCKRFLSNQEGFSTQPAHFIRSIVYTWRQLLDYFHIFLLMLVSSCLFRFQGTISRNFRFFITKFNKLLLPVKPPDHSFRQRI